MRDDEFSAADVAELLSAVPARNVVVVGGQAVNALAELYIESDPSLSSEAPFTSKDFDVFANRGELLHWKKVLGDKASIALPDPNHMSAVQNGILYYAMPDGRTMKVDFMTSVYGVNDDAIKDSAVPVDLVGGKEVEVALLNPVLCVESRVANVVGLPHEYDNDHGLKQLRASILACRHFLEDLAQQDVRETLKHIKELFRVARHRNAVRVYREKAVDVFKGVPSPHLLPSKFGEIGYPQMLDALAARRRSRKS